MNRLKLALRAESLRLPFRTALQTAARLKVAGVQLDAIGDLSPRILSETGRRELRYLLRANALELSAIGCPLRHGLDQAEGLEARIDYLRLALTMSWDLGTRTVVVPCSKVLEDPLDPAARRLRESLQALGRHGDKVGVTVALEPGMNPGEAFYTYLSSFDVGGLGANLNPASNLINGFDPYETARALRDKVVHVHASEARQTTMSRVAQEVPLGHGDIDWMKYLATLEEIDYHQWLTIAQDVGEHRVPDLTTSVALLRRVGA